MSEILFLIGAGASKDSEAPTMNDFLDVAYELNIRGKTGKHKSDFDSVFNAISELQAVYSKSQLDLDNLESVFAAFEMSRIINKLPGFTLEQIENLLKSIRWVIFKTIEQTMKFPVQDKQVRPSKSYNYLANLIIKLNDQGRKKRCSVITFNYDLGLDYALHFNSRPAEYFLKEDIKQSNTPLLKLHGSLNWIKCPECNNVFAWEFATFFQKYSYRFLEDVKSVIIDLASKLSESDIEHCNKKIIDPTPFIVPPTWNKSAQQQDLFKVWSQAAIELSDAENIFISGYSLTETDAFFRYLFALGSIGKKRIKRVWVFDPDKNDVVYKRFNELIGTGARPRFRFEKATFFELLQEVDKLSL